MRLSTVTFTLLKTGKPCLQANAHLINISPATGHLRKMSSCKPQQVLDHASANGADIINTSKDGYSTHLLLVICLHSESQSTYLLTRRRLTAVKFASSSVILFLITSFCIQSRIWSSYTADLRAPKKSSGWFGNRSSSMPMSSKVSPSSCHITKRLSQLDCATHTD